MLGYEVMKRQKVVTNRIVYCKTHFSEFLLGQTDKHFKKFDKLTSQIFYAK